MLDRRSLEDSVALTISGELDVDAGSGDALVAQLAGYGLLVHAPGRELGAAGAAQGMGVEARKAMAAGQPPKRTTDATVGQGAFPGVDLDADASGTQAVGNGIGLSLGVSTRHSAIGGATAAERNVISANDLGIVIGQAGSEYNWVLGNQIGTDAGGAIPLGNRSDGLLLMDHAAHSFVQDNIVAYNAADSTDRSGIYITQSPFNTIRRNSIHTNAGPGIVLSDGGNQMLPAPVILTVTENTVSGTACPGCTVEIFFDSADEGRTYEATAIANIAGLFAFFDKAGLQAGPYLTATATDGEGNTSEFSAPVARPVKVYLPIVLKGH